MLKDAILEPRVAPWPFWGFLGRARLLWASGGHLGALLGVLWRSPLLSPSGPSPGALSGPLKLFWSLLGLFWWLLGPSWNSLIPLIGHAVYRVQVSFSSRCESRARLGHFPSRPWGPAARRSWFVSRPVPPSSSSRHGSDPQPLSDHDHPPRSLSKNWVRKGSASILTNGLGHHFWPMDLQDPLVKSDDQVRWSK